MNGEGQSQQPYEAPTAPGPVSSEQPHEAPMTPDTGNTGNESDHQSSGTSVTPPRQRRGRFRRRKPKIDQPQLGVDGLDVTDLATLNDSVLSAQVTSRCLVDDWFHARSRRSCPLHRWLMDNAATAELPARSPARPRRDARRAPAVQHVSRWAHDLDTPGVRCGGVRATATYRLPRPRWAGVDPRLHRLESLPAAAAGPPPLHWGVVSSRAG